MKRIYLADAQPDERSALRLMLEHLNLKIVGEAGDWPSTLAMAPATYPDMVLVDWGLVSHESGNALTELRMACQSAVVIILLSHLDAHDPAAISLGADLFINKGEPSDRVAERLQNAANSIVAG